MAAATVKEIVQTADPNIEVVRLQATHGETYSSRKFKRIVGGHATYLDTASLTTGSGIQVKTGSGTSVRTVTLYNSGMSDNDVLLTIYGNE